MNKIFILVIMLLSLSAFAGASSSSGTGNPASILCVQELKGSLFSVSTPTGDYAICRLEEWSLYRAMIDHNIHPYYPQSNSETIGMPNPASYNCVKLGGRLDIQDTQNGQIGICSLEEWTLYRIFHSQN